ncbi:MAG: hypothetical protein CEN89_396 [Candidatus Berkelbacteria bacterium Licking1014_7]|uniref:DUF2304 domain-containing protein n=1 Tax=Candidatus Berkelbacteria bacterium Licking1014_7 TaxID=2017147 RepID=A0A554LJ68_9BACT|nr:MAG: hypothetical protein CEN89_396 [Candidatus Berkelbacteria bacterium Licking1014_7]
MIFFIQAISAFLAGLVISKSWNDFRRGREALSVFIFWVIAWGLIVLLAFFPILVDKITFALGGQIIGMGRIFGIALVFVFFVVYRVYLKSDRVETELNELVRKIALKKISRK